MLPLVFGALMGTTPPVSTSDVLIGTATPTPGSGGELVDAAAAHEALAEHDAAAAFDVLAPHNALTPHDAVASHDPGYDAAATRGAGGEGMADRLDGPMGSLAVMLPAPIPTAALHENLSRGHAHVSVTPPFIPAGSILSAHLSGTPTAGEPTCLDHEGRHRHRWLQTYRR